MEFYNKILWEEWKMKPRDKPTFSTDENYAFKGVKRRYVFCEISPPRMQRKIEEFTGIYGHTGAIEKLNMEDYERRYYEKFGDWEK